ncbi:MAG: class I SAM-dependent methyltransferase [Chlorobi bacterium]|nr:class I SAM-dependent methyltransferase [Chlorobiota bacterium]
MNKILLWRAFHFAKWLIKGKSCHSIHSPFLFNLCRAVFCQPMYESRWLFKKWVSLLPLQHKSIAIKSAIHPLDAKLLLGLTRFLEPEVIIEIGTGFGFSTTILHHANPKASLLTFESDPERHAIAKNISLSIHNSKYSQKHITFINKPFPSNTLSTFSAQSYLVFIDGGHNAQKMTSYFRWLFNYLPKESVIVLHDIYWSREMLQTWNALWKNNRTTFWIDMFRLGILVLDYPAQRKRTFLRPGPPFFIPL